MWRAPPDRVVRMGFYGSLKVLVVDDHLGIRIGIAGLIDAERPRMRTVGTAATALDALKQATALQPDVVVLDVNLDGEDGLALIAALRDAAPCTVIVLTSLSDPVVSECARRLGAHACIHKSAPAAELITEILSVRRLDFASSAATPLNAGVGLSPAFGSKFP